MSRRSGPRRNSSPLGSTSSLRRRTDPPSRAGAGGLRAASVRRFWDDGPGPSLTVRPKSRGGSPHIRGVGRTPSRRIFRRIFGAIPRWSRRPDTRFPGEPLLRVRFRRSHDVHRASREGGDQAPRDDRPPDESSEESSRHRAVGPGDAVPTNLPTNLRDDDRHNVVRSFRRIFRRIAVTPNAAVRSGIRRDLAGAGGRRPPAVRPTA